MEDRLAEIRQRAERLKNSSWLLAPECLYLLDLVQQQQETIERLEKEAGEDANRQDLLKMLANKIWPAFQESDAAARRIGAKYASAVNAKIWVTRAQFNAM